MNDGYNGLLEFYFSTDHNFLGILLLVPRFFFRDPRRVVEFVIYLVEDATEKSQRIGQSALNDIKYAMGNSNNLR